MLDRSEQRVAVGALGHDLDPGKMLQNPGDRLSDQERIVGERDADP